ncbi:hypothetical protein BJ322DRAFT_1096466 [Thelephora terrestris]|uniref:Secreted protein n=1 Tax=Thelephora terrestris TaxID=56493 RepID=A0A9P6H237_9AGAM|nr:hypothetical protein BJ322DRAFT_1096466 [Thelephora terrestris]
MWALIRASTYLNWAPGLSLACSFVSGDFSPSGNLTQTPVITLEFDARCNRPLTLASLSSSSWFSLKTLSRR